jgi:hypothetical protein
MRVVHDTEHVPEGVDHGCGHESRLPPRSDRLVLARAEREQTLERRLDVVNVPVGDRAARRVGVALRRVPAVDDPQLVLVVADPELGVSGSK